MRKYVIEARNPDGSLDLSGLQPEQVFGLAAITGITEDGMAKTIYARLKDVVLDGRDIALWPSKLNARWRAREKIW